MIGNSVEAGRGLSPLISFSLVMRDLRQQGKSFLRWLTTVFPRLNSTRYHCLPDVSFNRACKYDASNPKKKRKLLQHLKGVKSLRYTQQQFQTLFKHVITCMLQVNLFLRSICFQPRSVCSNLGQFVSTQVSLFQPKSICFNLGQLVFYLGQFVFNLGQFVSTQVNLVQPRSICFLPTVGQFVFYLGQFDSTQVNLFQPR